jgi:hypothetical protein
MSIGIEEMAGFAEVVQPIKEDIATQTMSISN